MELHDLVSDFARGLLAADERRPVFVSRTGRSYQPGIGPHGEDRAVALALAEMRAREPARYSRCGQSLAYPGSRQKCDLWFGEPIAWVVEVKMARFFGDNGKPDDTSIKDVISPFDVHRSALTDAAKLGTSALPGRKAVVIYGFDYERMPLERVIVAFERLASLDVILGPRCSASLPRLVHPVHSTGAVHGWEVLGPANRDRL